MKINDAAWIKCLTAVGMIVILADILFPVFAHTCGLDAAPRASAARLVVAGSTTRENVLALNTHCP